MTGKVVNLRAVRKAKARDEKRQTADENAARHGRTKGERAADAHAADRAERHLDDHKLEP